MKKFIFTAAATLLFMSSATAATFRLECNGCAALQDMKLASTKPAGSTVWVADYVNIRLNVYTVTYDARLAKNTASPETVSDVDMNSFLASAEFRTKYPGVSSAQEDLYDGSGVSAYDVTTSTQIRDSVAVNAANFVTGAKGEGLFADLARAYNQFRDASASWLGFSVTTEVRVTFFDGSSARFIVDAAHNRSAVYVTGSARDKFGNLVPDGQTSPGQIVGTYDFSNDYDAFESWLDNARLMGITITGPIPTRKGKAETGELHVICTVSNNTSSCTPSESGTPTGG